MVVEAGRVLVPIGVAARKLDMSRERLRVLADSGRVEVVRDSIGRRFLETQELDRLLRDLEARRKAAEAIRRHATRVTAGSSA